MTRPSIGGTIGRQRVAAIGARYSSFVGLMKVLLPIGAAALTVLVVAWPFVTGHDEGVPISFADVETAGPDTPLMSNARYFGSDERNRPFSVTADTVTQSAEDEDTVHFIAPKADMLLESGAWVALTAERGTLHRGAMSFVRLAPRASSLAGSGFPAFFTCSAWVGLSSKVRV